jgi:hypothetical protein
LAKSDWTKAIATRLKVQIANVESRTVRRPKALRTGYDSNAAIKLTVIIIAVNWFGMGNDGLDPSLSKIVVL